MISIILCTARRQPRFQEMADSIALNIEFLRKANIQEEVEWVVVDKVLWDNDRKEELKSIVNGRFKFVHVPPKPTVWQGPHRLTKKDYWAKSNALNTGIIYANGESLCFTDDCQLLSENWLFTHFSAHKLGLASCSAYKYVYAGTSKVVDGRLVEGKIQQPGDHRLTSMEVPGPVPGGWCYGGNWGAPLQALLKINGVDELLDGAGGLEDCLTGVRISRVIPLWFFPDAPVYQITETHETVTDFLTKESGGARFCQCSHAYLEHEHENPPMQCCKCPCVEYVPPPQPSCKGFAYLDAYGTQHHMTWNHLPVNRLHAVRFVKKEDGFYRQEYDPFLQEETKRYLPYGNLFDISDLRLRVRRGEEIPFLGKPEKDWRDSQLLIEM